MILFASPWLTSAPHLWGPLLADSLIASAWQGIALTAAAALALRLLPELSPAARAALWTVVLVLVAALPFFHALPAHALAAHPAVWHGEQRVSLVLATLWLAASVFRFTQLVASAVHLRRILRRAQPLAASEALTALLYRGGRRVLLCTSPAVDRPSVAGFFQPRILLPPALLADLGEADLRHILLHELEHLRRRDDWVNLVQQLSLVIFPLHPALLWLNRRLARERELACDDRVLRATGARKAYAACLARVAEGSLVHRGLSLAIGILGQRHSRRSRRSGSPELTQRVYRILAAPLPPRTGSPLRTRLAAGLIGAGLAGGTVLLAHSPELVSFGPNPTPVLAQRDAGEAALLPVQQRFALSDRPRPMLVKAALPQASRQGAISPMHNKALHRTRLKANLRRPLAHQPSAYSVLTSWHAGDVEPAQEIPALHMVPVLVRVTPVDFGSSSDSSQVWYTAVRWGGGWLLVQI